MSEKKGIPELDAAWLHILAMIFMTCDHLWATVVPGWDWLTCVGRITFPVYAYLLVEGYFHTGDLGRYVRRLLVLALVSELPFNLMTTDVWIFPFHQNVIWTLLLGLWMIHLNEKARKSGRLWLRILTGLLTCGFGYVAGMLTMVDYNGAGVLMILMFYFLRGRTWRHLVGQILGLYYINTELISGRYYDVPFFGSTFPFYQQTFSLLALIPIWLYRGRQGHHSKTFRWLCYGFYPAHMLLLGLIRSIFL